MGTTSSKRKKHKKQQQMYDTKFDSSPLQDLERLRSLSKNRLHRLSLAASPYFSKDSLQTSTMSLNNNSSSISSSAQTTCHAAVSFGTEPLSLDDHPVLTKLQNEQNARLEHMELRMAKIRTNAIQAAERRKYAHMFRAKPGEYRTEQLLKEASDALEVLKRQKKLGRLQQEMGSDQGEIIPVRILCDENRCEVDDNEAGPKSIPRKSEMWPIPLQSMNFSEPVMWLLLPFLLPLFLVLYLIRSLTSQSSDRYKKRH